MLLEIGSLPMEWGGWLPGIQLAYHTYGEYHPDHTPVVWVCHPLTASSEVPVWWKDLFEPEGVFDPRRCFIICVNNLGSCYGSTGPLSLNPETGQPYYDSFPLITIRDIARSMIEARKKLGIESIHVLIGGSMGGQIALEWALQEPERIQNLILIACNAKHSAWGIAFNESQRMAIRADPTYYERRPEGGQAGLRAARSIALLSYRNYQTYVHFQSDDSITPPPARRPVTYQQYQGEKLVRRFNAYSYVTLSYAMDSHDIFRNRTPDFLSTLSARTLIIGIEQDILFPICEQIFLHENIPNSTLRIIQSLYGHDGFLVDTHKIQAVIEEFLRDDGRFFMSKTYEAD